MVTSKEIPKRADLVDFQYAVAGHAGTLCDPDGVLFIKPCTQSEIDFYETARAQHPDFADLMPLFMGTLMLSDATDVSSINEQLPAVADAISPEIKQTLADMARKPPPSPDTPVTPATPATPATPTAPVDGETWVPRGGQSIRTDRAIVLENATYGYKKPNILDVKLGQRLWADDAPRQKRIRMDEVRAQTTHDKLGFRIAGMRVFRGSADASELDGAGYRTYDKDYGRYDVNDSNVAEAFRRFIFNESAGVDPDVGRAIAQAFKTDLERVRDVMERTRSRMYSASLLFVFEGDGAALREAVEDTSASSATTSKRASASANTSTTASRSRSRRLASSEDSLDKPVDRSTSRTDSGIVIEDDEFETEARARARPRARAEVDVDVRTRLDAGLGAGDEEDEEEEEEDDDDDDDDDESINMPHIYGLRLIDFAHAQFCPEEEGPDENNLVGVRSLIRIFDELTQDGKDA